jgi:hypothetical protein
LRAIAIAIVSYSSREQAAVLVYKVSTRPSALLLRDHTLVVDSNCYICVPMHADFSHNV